MNLRNVFSFYNSIDLTHSLPYQMWRIKWKFCFDFNILCNEYWIYGIFFCVYQLKISNKCVAKYKKAKMKFRSFQTFHLKWLVQFAVRKLFSTSSMSTRWPLIYFINIALWEMSMKDRSNSIRFPNFRIGNIQRIKNPISYWSFVAKVIGWWP